MTSSITLTIKILLAAAKKEMLQSLWLIAIKRNRVASHFEIEEEVVERNRVVYHSRIKQGMEEANGDLSDVNFSIQE